MTHACACCKLRYTNASELWEHVRAEHHEKVDFHEERSTVRSSRGAMPGAPWWWITKGPGRRAKGTAARAPR